MTTLTNEEYAMYSAMLEAAAARREEGIIELYNNFDDDCNPIDDDDDNDEEARQDAEYAEYIMRTTTQKIAVNKIKRNKIFNLGLGLKLSMRDCGMY